MDPTANLAEQLRLVAEINDLLDKGAQVAPRLAARLGQLVEALDQWLRFGGSLPGDWPMVDATEAKREGRARGRREVMTEVLSILDGSCAAPGLVRSGSVRRWLQRRLDQEGCCRLCGIVFLNKTADDRDRSEYCPGCEKEDEGGGR